MAIVFPPVIYFVNIFFYTKRDGYKSELMLPVSKRAVVISRYVLYVLLIAVFSLALLGVLAIKIGFTDSAYELSCLLLATSASLIFGSILLYLIFIFGHDKLKSFLVITALGMVLIVRPLLQGLAYILNLSELSDIYNHTYIFLMLLLLSVVIYISSCLLSIKVFTHKEF
jgi:hypothetical protein